MFNKSKLNFEKNGDSDHNNIWSIKQKGIRDLLFRFNQKRYFAGFVCIYDRRSSCSITQQKEISIKENEMRNKKYYFLLYRVNEKHSSYWTSLKKPWRGVCKMYECLILFGLYLTYRIANNIREQWSWA